MKVLAGLLGLGPEGPNERIRLDAEASKIRE